MDELLVAPTLTAKDLSNREGFDGKFLGSAVSLPTLPGVETVLLPYTHFSVLMRMDKRLAAVTGLGHRRGQAEGSGPFRYQLAAGSAPRRGPADGGADLCPQ